jgi:hypothetical protein
MQELQASTWAMNDSAHLLNMHDRQIFDKQIKERLDSRLSDRRLAHRLGAITGFDLTMHPSGTYSTDQNSKINPGIGQTSGKAYAAEYEAPTPGYLTNVVLDMDAAYADAAGRLNNDGERKNVKGGILSGETLTPGVYTFTTNVHLTGDITFNGDFSDIFIIQITGNLKQDVSKKVILLGGAKPENIFWHMEGILLVKTDVTFVTDSSLNGRVLTQTECNLQIATMTQPVLVEDVEDLSHKCRPVVSEIVALPMFARETGPLLYVSSMHASKKMRSIQPNRNTYKTIGQKSVISGLAIPRRASIVCSRCRPEKGRLPTCA